MGGVDIEHCSGDLLLNSNGGLIAIELKKNSKAGTVRSELSCEYSRFSFFTFLIGWYALCLLACI